MNPKEKLQRLKHRKALEELVEWCYRNSATISWEVMDESLPRTADNLRVSINFWDDSKSAFTTGLKDICVTFKAEEINQWWSGF